MSKHSDPDRWVARLRAEPEVRDAAIEELRGIILRGLTRALNNRYGSKFQAEDIVQDALLKILDSLDRYEGRSRFTTWAMAVAIRVGITELRKKSAQSISLDSLTAENSLSIELAEEDSASLSQQLDQRNVLSKLKNIINTQLSRKQRLAVHSLLEGVPVDEIARRSGSNRNAVYKLIHDSRLKLREGLEREGILADDVAAIFASGA